MSLVSLIETGTKLWLDSIDPELVRESHANGATGATSNPIIVAGLLQSGRFDSQISALMDRGMDDKDIAWKMTDQLVNDAQNVFLEVWQRTKGNDGYVSFELDPLLEDIELGPDHPIRVQRYIELGKQWSQGHDNRMIKVPATPAGLEALEDLVAHGVTLNVTLIFSERQYQIARDNVWRGAQKRKSLDRFKSVYSIFVSRVDAYTKKHVPDLSHGANGEVGILNAKRIWQDNQNFWAQQNVPLQQEIIFASTGTKDPSDPPWKYVQSFAGSDIETNPPATNDAVDKSGVRFDRQVDQLPSAEIISEIDQKVDFEKMERVLMEEGLQKFADPQKQLIELIGEKRKSLTTSDAKTG